MNQGVFLAVDVDVEAGDLQGVTVADLVHPVAEVLELAGDRWGSPQRQVGTGEQGLAYRVGVEVIRVFVGDQDGGSEVQGGGRVGEGAGVDDQGGAVFLQPDARVAELGELHGPHDTAGRSGSAQAIEESLASEVEQQRCSGIDGLDHGPKGLEPGDQGLRRHTALGEQVPQPVEEVAEDGRVGSE